MLDPRKILVEGAIGTAFWTALVWAAKVVWKLAENGVLGWGDAQIAARLQPYGPLARRMTPVLLTWFPPIIVASLATWGLFVLAERRLHAKSQRDDSPHDLIAMQDAAQIAYERAERDGWLDVVVGMSQDPADRLTTFKYMMVIQATEGGVVLVGVEPPSTQPYPIPSDRLRHLHPSKGVNTLHETHYLGKVSYTNVEISRSDLEKVIQIYQGHATDGPGWVSLENAAQQVYNETRNTVVSGLARQKNYRGEKDPIGRTANTVFHQVPIARGLVAGATVFDEISSERKKSMVVFDDKKSVGYISGDPQFTNVQVRRRDLPSVVDFINRISAAEL